MTALQDNVRDESIAVAKAYSHPTVERRHVLWGVLSALNDLAPSDITFAAVRKLLEPAGSSYAVPIVSPEAEEALATITEAASAVALARQLATELGLFGGPGAAGSPGSGPTTTDAGSGGGATTVSGTASGSTAGATTAAGAPLAADTEASVLAELDALIGLGEVKATIRRLLALHHLNEERLKAGLPEVNPSKHLVFTGDPGTGKTTVAKLVARLYKVTGVVSKGQCVETGRADLVAGYVGQTALKVKDVVQRAIGGVLFIDEAYALAGMGVEDFGTEAIATLVQMMEEHRDDLAVIVAGYSAEMREFIEFEPGAAQPVHALRALPQLLRRRARGDLRADGGGSRRHAGGRRPGSSPERSQRGGNASGLRQRPIHPIDVRGGLREHGCTGSRRRQHLDDRAQRHATR